MTYCAHYSRNHPMKQKRIKKLVNAFSLYCGNYACKNRRKNFEWLPPSPFFFIILFIYLIIMTSICLMATMQRYVLEVKAIFRLGGIACKTHFTYVVFNDWRFIDFLPRWPDNVLAGCSIISGYLVARYLGKFMF